MMRDDFDRVGDNAVDEIMGGRCLKFVHKTVSEGGGGTAGGWGGGRM